MCRRHKISQRITEPHSPWQNPAELSGGIVKRKVQNTMRKTNTPLWLWDYCWEYECSIRSLTATDHIQLDGSTPFAKVHGYTPNIAEYVQFKWFEWVWYHDPNDPNKQMLGRWCGPAHNIGQGMAYHILSSKGKMVTRSTEAPLTQDKIKLPQNMERMESFAKEVESIIGNFSKSTSNRIDLEVW